MKGAEESALNLTVAETTNTKHFRKPASITFLSAPFFVVRNDNVEKLREVRNEQLPNMENKQTKKHIFSGFRVLGL